MKDSCHPSKRSPTKVSSSLSLGAKRFPSHSHSAHENDVLIKRSPSLAFSSARNAEKLLSLILTLESCTHAIQLLSSDPLLSLSRSFCRHPLPSHSVLCMQLWIPCRNVSECCSGFGNLSTGSKPTNMYLHKNLRNMIFSDLAAFSRHIVCCYL